jgi:Zn-dependent protease with chaperone function
MSSDQQYVALIERLEIQAREAPGAYRFRLALLAAFGFVVLGGSMVLAFGLSVGLVVLLLAFSPFLLAKLIKVVWIPIAFGWMILRALWMKFDPPTGHTLQAGEAPALVAEVERLRLAAGAPKLDAIVIDEEMNAGASSVPRALGLLGNRHYLVLGLPLMQALDRDQLAAVIAHEFGHFGGGHSRFAGWIYHVRISWLRVLHALSTNQAMMTGVFLRFFRWYAPYFNAYSFVLARGNEYEADAVAARVVGADAMAQALVRTDLASTYMQRDFWPGLQREIATAPQPPQALFREMAHRLHLAHPEDGARLAAALARKSDYDDTHPTLAQRVAALGTDAGLVDAPKQSAAETLLGPLLPELERRFSEQWHAGIVPVWEEEHRKLGEGRQRLAELDENGVQTPAEKVEYAHLVEQLRPETDVVPLYRDAIEAVPDDASAHFRLGFLLLKAGDGAGTAHLLRAIELEPDATAPACELLYAHYREQDDSEGKAWVEATMDTYYGRHAQAAQARSQLNKKDELQPHGLDDAALAKLRESLAGFGKVAHAWIVRKPIDDPGSDAPAHYVLLVSFRGLVLDEGSTLERLVERIELPGTFIAFTSANDRGMASRVKKIARAPVFG